MSGLARAAAAVLLAAAAGTQAAPLDPKAVFASYQALQTYCDEVAVSHGRGRGSIYRRCFAADGRFKVHEIVKDYADSENIWWGDREWQYVWRGHWKPWRGTVTRHYSEDRHRNTRGWVNNVLDLFQLSGLAGFDADPACEPDLRCYTRSMTDHENDAVVGSERLWLRAGDGLVARFERHWNNGMSFSIVVNSVRLNAAEVADFEHTAPLLARFSYSARPKTFLAGVLIACVAAGFLLWLRWDLRRLKAGAELPMRRRMWRIYLGVVLACAVPCGLLTLSLWGVEGGHPPPIYVALMLDLYVGFGLACLAALLAGVHLARKEALRRVSSAPSAPPA